MSHAGEFRVRAKAEADRYGPDPWIFVRELLQNARDAGATKVVFRVDESNEGTRVTCVDDGEGMSFEHARRYLFSLYSSSKEGSRNQVGRFGVGFWSILRFDPDRLVIASRTPGAEAWAVEFDGALEHGRQWTPDMPVGTRVVLLRGPGDGHDARRLRDAVWQNARFLHRRDDTRLPIEIVVNGERLNASFNLPAPSARFARGAVRGVVGLGESPRVELFSRGLRVRAAASLDDLLSASGHTSRSRVRFSELPGAVAPQALLESDALELLLSRSDARDDRVLRRLVKLANDELELLVDRQLEQVRPPSIGERLARLFSRFSEIPVTWRAVLGAMGGALLALVIGGLLWGDLSSGVGFGGSRAGGSNWGGYWPFGPMEVARPSGGGYTDLAKRYRGPQVSELDPNGPIDRVELTYRPPGRRPYFNAMTVELDADGNPAPVELDGAPTVAPCVVDCIEVELGVQSPPGLLRIPVPTGQVLDPDSVFLADQKVPIVGTQGGSPAIMLARDTRATLSYRTGPGTAAKTAKARPAIGLPNDLETRARRLRGAPVPDRVQALLDEVQARIRYSTSAEVSALHREARRAGRPFVARSLEIGAGDCDVQNGLLVELLNAADVPARLAVGYVGREGEVSSWLHAWVEFRDESGTWRVADASENANVVATSTSTAATGGDEPRPGPLGPTPDATTSSGQTEPTGGPQPASTPSAGNGGNETLRRYGPPVALLGGIALLAVGVTRLRRQTSRELSLEQGQDLSRLLQGALQKPAAFARLPALFKRRLIPLVGGAALSLDQARALASQGRLFRSAADNKLAQRAARRRVPVLDSSTPEGETVASTLGAVDLDAWSRRLEQARSSTILQAAETALRSDGYRWRLRSVSNLPELVAWLDLRALRLDRDHDRLIVVDRMDPWHRAADGLASSRPAEATFLIVEHLADRMKLDERERARLLAPLAERMLEEQPG